MLSKKIILFALLALPLVGCDRKSDTAAPDYRSQSEILDMQEEEFNDSLYNPEEVAPEREEVDEEEFDEDSEVIDNTSSEADDTIY